MGGLALTPTHPPQQASVLSAGGFGPRLHHLPPWHGPLHGISGKGPGGATHHCLLCVHHLPESPQHAEEEGRVVLFM